MFLKNGLRPIIKSPKRKASIKFSLDFDNDKLYCTEKLNVIFVATSYFCILLTVFSSGAVV